VAGTVMDAGAALGSTVDVATALKVAMAVNGALLLPKRRMSGPYVFAAHTVCNTND